MPRNPILAKLFRMVRLAENAGIGFDKIEENWKVYKSTVPDYQIEFDSVVVYFKMEAKESVGERSGKIIELIKNNMNISIPEMAETIGISECSIERNIESLKKKGLLEPIGPAKGGHWQIIE